MTLLTRLYREYFNLKIQSINMAEKLFLLDPYIKGFDAKVVALLIHLKSRERASWIGIEDTCLCATIQYFMLWVQ
jgi:hypothetical protein